MAFILWCILGIPFIGLGIYCKYSKRPIGFWANAETFPVNDAAKYNSAMGKLFFTYGTILMLLGIPLLGGQNSSMIIITILGTVVETIGAVIVYTTLIEKKYRLK